MTRTKRSTKTQAASTDITTSNSLADLAARIKAEHDAFIGLVKTSLKHAVNAGRLLIEAKEQLKHGQWLPWLREHCGVSERSAQRYMTLAAWADETKIRHLADFTSDDASAPLSIEKAAEAGEWDLMSRLMLDGPFRASDFRDFDFVRTKLFQQLNVPAIAAWCFDVADETADSRPALRLCPWDELVETAKVLAPVASEDRKENPLRLDFETFGSMQAIQAAIVELRFHAMWLLGNVLSEMQCRDGLDDAQYEREWAETHQHVMSRLEAKIASYGGEAAP